jgi:general secretion pathway protein D
VPPLSERLQAQRLQVLAGDTAASAAAAGVSVQLEGPVHVVPDETSNSLLVRALPRDWNVVEEAIAALDLRPLQVMIEVLIAEVRQSRDLDVKVTGAAAKSPDANTRTSGTLSGEEASTAAFLLRLARGGSISTDVALSALATRGDVRVLSRPLLMAQNNLEARILVGSQRPFVQLFRSLPTDNGVRDQVVQYRDVGTTLAILPTINPDGYVSLQVSQEVSSATAETQFGAPVISTREASTHLFVKDGQTAVMGGLVDRTQEKTRTGIPWLSSLPWIGGAFGSTRTSTANSELFLFLTPHIIASDDDLQRIRDAVDKKAAPDSLPANPPVVPAKKP